MYRTVKCILISLVLTVTFTRADEFNGNKYNGSADAVFERLFNEDGTRNFHDPQLSQKVQFVKFLEFGEKYKGASNDVKYRFYISKRQGGIQTKRIYSSRRLPSSYSIKEFVPQIYDQGHIGTCYSNALSLVITMSRVANDCSKRECDLDKVKSDYWKIRPSRAFIAYTSQRVKAEITGGMPFSWGNTFSIMTSTIDVHGVPTEEIYKYPELTFTNVESLSEFESYVNMAEYDDEVAEKVESFYRKFLTPPDPFVYAEAKAFKDITSLKYYKVKTLDDVKALITKSIPVYLGFNIYPTPDYDFNKWSQLQFTDDIYHPSVDGVEKIGGHAVTIVGYDDDYIGYTLRECGTRHRWKGVFEIANSWGTNRKNGGYFLIPYETLKERFDAYFIYSKEWSNLHPF